MDPFVKLLSMAYPDLLFKAGSQCYWSPETRTITYTCTEEHGNINKWSLLHEVGHALLGHASYNSDIELLQKEMFAWEKARTLAASYRISIDEAYIQNCLDSYREWLNRRSTCPNCRVKTLQVSADHYQCYNCSLMWSVTPARHNRTYRRTSKTTSR